MVGAKAVGSYSEVKSRGMPKILIDLPRNDFNYSHREPPTFPSADNILN